MLKTDPFYSFHQRDKQPTPDQFQNGVYELNQERQFLIPLLEDLARTVGNDQINKIKEELIQQGVFQPRNQESHFQLKQRITLNKNWEKQERKSAIDKVKLVRTFLEKVNFVEYYNNPDYKLSQAIHGQAYWTEYVKVEKPRTVDLRNLEMAELQMAKRVIDQMKRDKINQQHIPIASHDQAETYREQAVYNELKDGLYFLQDKYQSIHYPLANEFKIIEKFIDTREVRKWTVNPPQEPQWIADDTSLTAQSYQKRKTA